MPAVSKSQQRLFGMVHAYNTGKFHGSRDLRKRIAGISKRISEEDAEHFAKTPHADLPETKKAQYVAGPDGLRLNPEQVRELYGYIPAGSVTAAISGRAKKRRTLLGSLLRGGTYGAVLGGLGGGLLGAVLARKAVSGKAIDPDILRRNMLNSGLQVGLWGATRGAGIGALGGGGLYVLDKVRGGDEE